MTGCEEAAEHLLAYADGVPVGLVRPCRVADCPEYLDERRTLDEVPESARAATPRLSSRSGGGPGR
ncbi:hypothetical protein [Nocardia xishanensis]